MFSNWGPALICLRGTRGSSNTGVLEMGTTTMWWRGFEIAVSSAAELKQEITPAPSVLEKIAATGIYSYRCCSEDENSERIVDETPRVGFVLGRDYAAPPEEVIGEDGASVNLYASIAMAWKGIQELTERCSAQEARIAELEERLSKYENHNPSHAA